MRHSLSKDKNRCSYIILSQIRHHYPLSETDSGTFAETQMICYAQERTSHSFLEAGFRLVLYSTLRRPKKFLGEFCDIFAFVHEWK